MYQLDRNIAMNLKRIRKSRNMSLDMLAVHTGVSKSMLGQIERGESNPTVGTIGKIVEGLRISFEELIYEPKAAVSVIHKEELQSRKEAGNGCKNYLFFPFDKKKGLEGRVFELNPGSVYYMDSRGENMTEYITVFGGELTLEIGEKRYTVSAGNAIKVTADTAHAYESTGDEMLVMNITYAWEGQRQYS